MIQALLLKKDSKETWSLTEMEAVMVDDHPVTVHDPLIADTDQDNAILQGDSHYLHMLILLNFLNTSQSKATKQPKEEVNRTQNFAAIFTQFAEKQTRASHPEILTQTISTKTQADLYTWTLKTKTCAAVPQNS